MKVLVIQCPLHDEYGFIESYENEETWVFHNDEIPLSDVIKEWKNSIEEFPKLYQYLEFIGGQLVEFTEALK